MKKFNRNSDCWCGSKLKYKKCCMEMDLKLKSFKIQGYPIPKKETIKTPEEIKGIKKSCELTTYLLNELETRIQPGVTTNELNDWVHNETLHHKAIPAPLNYKGFPKSICTSKNNVICHGIPNDDPLEEGDILNVDITCILNGFYGDSCRMYTVGNVNKEALHLIDITNDNLLENYFKIRKELFKYSNKLLKKKEIIVFNKIDMINEEEINSKINIFKKKIKKKIFKISALKHKGLTNIKKNLINNVY